MHPSRPCIYPHEVVSGDHTIYETSSSLPTHERLVLIELLAHSLHNDVEAAESGSDDASELQNGRPDVSDTMGVIEQRAASLGLRVPPDSAIHRLRGYAGTNATPSTKREIQAVIMECGFIDRV